MTIEQSNVIDFMGIDPKTGRVILFISDHLEWGPYDDLHMDLLDAKINAYVSAIESGEIYELYPKAAGREFIITTQAKYPLNETGRRFFEEIRFGLSRFGVEFEFDHFTGDVS